MCMQENAVFDRLVQAQKGGNISWEVPISKVCHKDISSTVCGIIAV